MNRPPPRSAAARSFAVLPLLALALAAPAADAHEYWLAPSRYRAAPGDTVEVRAWVGTGFRGEPKAFVPSRVERLVWRAAHERDVASLARDGAPAFARCGIEDAGGALVAYQSRFVPIELAGAEFDAYLRLEGLDAPLAARTHAGEGAGLVRERYARCPKTWIGGRDRGRVTTPVGLPLELVPLADPASAARLRVRVLFEGRPLAHALVRAFRQPLAAGGEPVDAAGRDSLPPVAEARTAADGTTTFVLDAPGEWLLACVHMVPCPEPREAEWQSWWASLTFALEPAARSPRR